MAGETGGSRAGWTPAGAPHPVLALLSSWVIPPRSSSPGFGFQVGFVVVEQFIEGLQFSGKTRFYPPHPPQR
jgi:hypothetical protein